MRWIPRPAGASPVDSPSYCARRRTVANTDASTARQYTRPMPGAPVICPGCGKKLSPAQSKCVYCGAELAVEWPGFDLPPGSERALDPASQLAPDTVREPEPEPAPAPPPPLVPFAKRTTCPNCGGPLASGECHTCGWGKPQGGASRDLVVRFALFGIIAACLCAAVAVMVLRSGAAAEKERIAHVGGDADDLAILQEAFTAVSENNFTKFSAIAMVRADFILARELEQAAEMQKKAAGKEPGLTGSEMLKRFGHTAEVVAPEERRTQREAFERAVAGGPEQIDFHTSRFLSAGTLVGREAVPLADEQALPVRVYSVRLTTPSGEVDSRDLLPLFAIADYRGAPKLLGLRFTPIAEP
jgi:hypothetical protein